MYSLHRNLLKDSGNRRGPWAPCLFDSTGTGQPDFFYLIPVRCIKWAGRTPSEGRAHAGKLHSH